MSYHVNLSKTAIRALIKINEPTYSNLKSAIYSLANDPRPSGYKNKKEEMVIEFGLVSIE